MTGQLCGKRRAFSRLALSALLVALTGCNETDPPPQQESRSRIGPPPAAPIQFAEVAHSANVEFVPRNGEDRDLYTILETLGTGVALFDFDRDGRLDLFFPGGGTLDKQGTPVSVPNALYRQVAPWKFAQVKASRLCEPRLYSHGANVGDYDADGFPDILLTGYGGAILYRNQGDGTFSELPADASGIEAPDWSASSAWADFNSDGILDCYLTGYLVWDHENRPRCGTRNSPRICDPSKYEPLSDRLFQGTGDGRFRDVSKSHGLVTGGNGLGVLAADWDHDGDTDLYVANDATANWVYFNDGSGYLEERGLLSGASLGLNSNEDGSMGVDLGDFNGDGLPDLWVTNFESQLFALYRNEGRGLFRHVSRTTGIANVGRLYVGFGTVCFDADLDGDEDLVVTNGHVFRHASNSSVLQQALFLENENSSFTNIADRIGPYFQESHMGRGLAVGDLDIDGDLDLVISHTNAPVALLENRTQTQGSFIKLKLVGTRSHRDAIGARITAMLPHGAGTILRHVKGGGSYLSSSDLTIHLGLPEGIKLTDLRIDWPAGGTTEISGVAAGQSYLLIEGRRTLIGRRH